MTSSRRVLIVVGAMLAGSCVACGEVESSAPRLSPTPLVPSPIIRWEQPVLTVERARIQSNSCPDGDRIELIANTREGRVTLRWRAVEGIKEYLITIEKDSRRGWGIVGEVETGGNVLGDYRDISWGGGSGRFRATIQTINDCGGVGVYGPYVTWEIDDDEAGGGASSPGTDPPGGGGSGGNGGNGNGGDTKPCHNGNSGDHNDDGKRDCGKDK